MTGYIFKHQLRTIFKWHLGNYNHKMSMFDQAIQYRPSAVSMVCSNDIVLPQEFEVIISQWYLPCHSGIQSAHQCLILGLGVITGAIFPHHVNNTGSLGKP